MQYENRKLTGENERHQRISALTLLLSEASEHSELITHQ